MTSVYDTFWRSGSEAHKLHKLFRTQGTVTVDVVCHIVNNFHQFGLYAVVHVVDHSSWDLNAMIHDPVEMIDDLAVTGDLLVTCHNSAVSDCY